MADYPRQIVRAGHSEPVPRRIRAVLGDELVLDTIAARYVWEHPRYPQYYVPLADVRAELLDEDRQPASGDIRRLGLRAGGQHRPDSVTVHATGEFAGYARLDWAALDAWYEEDEQVFVHPRDPYVRVDAIRSSRAVRVELDGVLLAEAASAVLVFETGLPTRYYLDRTALNLAHLTPSPTRTGCPYKGFTSNYWTVRTPVASYPDLAWSYRFPTAALLPIAGLVAFFNEQVELSVAGRRLARPGH